MQAYSPDRFHSFTNFLLELEYIRCSCAATVDDGQRVLARNAHCTGTEAFREPRVLDEPGG